MHTSAREIIVSGETILFAIAVQNPICTWDRRALNLAVTHFLAISYNIRCALLIYVHLEAWVAKLVARQFGTAVLWARIQTSLKNHKWET
jgi:hypothetical protein